MLFIVSRAWKRFCKNFIKYLFIILELAIGLTFIACQKNVALSIEHRMNDFRAQYSENGISINSYAKEFNYARKDIPINGVNFDYLAEKYNETANISYLSYGNVIYNYYESIPVIGMSDYAFRNLFHQECEDRVYIGAKAREIFYQQDIKLGESNILFNAQGIQAGERIYPWEEFGKEQNNVSIISFSSFAGEDIKISECIVIPVSLQKGMEKDGIFYNSSFELIFKENFNLQMQALIEDEIITYLAEDHGNYTYETVNKIQDYIKNSKDLSDSLRILSWVAKYSMLLITAGMIGILLILLECRRKDWAVSLITGAVKWKLSAELLVELLIICTGGCMAAVAASAAITPLLDTSQYRATVTGQSILLIIIISLVIAVSSCFLSIANIKIKRPIDILRAS